MSTDADRVDTLTSVAKGVLGAVPFIGPALAEIVGAIIPNQRMDRIARLVEFLHRKLADFDQAVVAERMKTPEGVDLLEDAFQQSARALSDERLEYIASVLKKGITEEQAKLAETKFLMWLLGQLSDPEVILLAWLNMLPARDAAFEQRHRQVIEPRVAHLGSTQEEIDDATLHEARKAHLVSLGLLQPRFSKTIKQQVPEFDPRTGMIKALGHDVTPLGRILLKTIDAG